MTMEDKLVIKTLNKMELPNCKGYTFLLPSVSVGNVGQLSIDVIISSLNLRKVAIVHHSALLPIIGHDPYNDKSTEITTAADIHINAEKKLLVLQIRTPLIKEEKEAFLVELTAWIKSLEVADVVILSSCHAHLRHDSQISGSQFRYLTNDLPHPNIDALISLGSIELEEREDEFGDKRKHVPGAGFMYKFLNQCGLPTVALLKFVDEGDNTRDAYALVSYLNAWMKYQNEENQMWKCPFSWKNLFGPSPPSLLY